MHYGILNSSGNALAWFTDEAEARRALDEMLAESPDADLDLVAFSAPGRPVEPISASVRSAWPAARLVWSNQTTHAAVATRTIGNMVIASTSANATDDRVELEA